ncbi:transposase [Francisella noatunensis]
MNKLINFEKFRKILKGIHTQDRSNQGRPSYDSVMMFKLFLLLCQSYSLSDRELASSFYT